MSAYVVELLGILIALGLLIFLAFRGFSLLLAAPAAAIVAAAFSGEPLLAKWTLTFMQGAAGFIANFFPLFLLGGVFGKLMDDSGAALSIARTITERLGTTRAIMAVVLACAALTYGGVCACLLACETGSKGYHDEVFEEGPYPGSFRASPKGYDHRGRKSQCHCPLVTRCAAFAISGKTLGLRQSISRALPLQT